MVDAPKTKIAFVLLMLASLLPLAGADSCGSPPTLLAVHNIHPDHLGSATLLTDTAGVFERTTFTPFGNIDTRTGSRSASLPTHAYTGHEYDPESDLYYMRARYYDPSLGRFLSPDPALNDGGGSFDRIANSPGHLNAYSYVTNRPTVMLDPDGQLGWFAAILAVLPLIGISQQDHGPEVLPFVGAVDGVVRDPDSKLAWAGLASEFGGPLGRMGRNVLSARNRLPRVADLASSAARANPVRDLPSGNFTTRRLLDNGAVQETLAPGVSLEAAERAVMGQNFFHILFGEVFVPMQKVAPGTWVREVLEGPNYLTRAQVIERLGSDERVALAIGTFESQLRRSHVAFTAEMSRGANRYLEHLNLSDLRFRFDDVGLLEVSAVIGGIDPF